MPSILANWMLVVALAMNVSWQADTIIPSEGSLGFMLRRDQVKEEEEPAQVSNWAVYSRRIVTGVWNEIACG